MRALLIVNPHATSTTARRRDLLMHALASEVALSVQHTGGRGHAAELAAAAVGVADLIVVHGGDGTVNEVVNGIMHRSAPGQGPLLAVVPGGSTNVFARAVGIEADPTAATEQILEAVGARRLPRVVSLGRADDRYFTFNAGLGLDAEVVDAVEQVRANGRAISNALHVRKTISQYFRTRRRPGRLQLRIPGEDPIEGARLAFVSNVDPWTYWEARPVRTNPGTGPTTGLGLFALRSLGIPTVARVARQMLVDRPAEPGGPSRGPVSRQLVRRDDLSEVDVRSDVPIGLQVDGDYLGLRSGVRFTSVPAALRVLGPVAPLGGVLGASG